MPFYRVELYKNWNTRDAKGEWSNTYEAQAANAGLVQSEIIPILILAEKAIHLPHIQFLRYVISQYNDAAGTLNPAVRLPGPMLGTGLRDGGGGQPYDAEMAYQTKFTSNGRAFGKKAYHGCLTELDLNTTGGPKATLEPSSSLVQGGVAWGNYATPLADIISDDPTAPRLGMYTRFQTSPRKAIPKVYGPWAFYNATEVNQLKVGNVKMDHGWFNRA